MFGKKKAAENRFIIAVKDYENSLKQIKSGEITLPYDKETYLKLLETPISKVDNLKDIKKFIKENNKTVAEVKHFWGGLIEQDYTLLSVEYTAKLPTIEQLCSKDIFRYICSV